MSNYTPAKKLKIFVSNTDKFRKEPLYEVLIYAAKRYGLSGATALKGYMGFGASSAVTNLRFWEVSEKIPVVVEIIDSPEKIDGFIEKILPYFDKIRYGCLITTETVEIVLQKTGTRKKSIFGI